MKKTLFTTLILFIGLFTKAQHTFKFQKFLTDGSVLVEAVAEDTLGNILVMYQNGSPFNYSESFLMVLSPEGNFIKESPIGMTFVSGANRIEFIKGEYYLFGNKDLGEGSSELVIFKIHGNYVPKYINAVNINSQPFYRPRIVNIIADTLVMVAAVWNPFEGAVFNEMVVVKFNAQFDTLKTMHFPDLSLLNIQYDSEKKTYNMFGQGSKSMRLYIFNQNFEIINSYGYMGPTTHLGMRKVQNSYIVIGDSWEGNNIQLALYDSTAQKIKSLELGDPNILQQVGASRSIINSKDGNFLAFSFDWDYALNLSTNPLALHLIKFDSAMNVLYKKDYMHNGSQFAVDFWPTMDGGCVMASRKHDTTQIMYETGLQILKVDSLGNYNATNIFDSRAGQKSISLFPNPGYNQINIKSVEKISDSEFSLFKPNGKLVFKQTLESEYPQISVSELPAGLYFYEIKNTKQLLSTGKWVKQ